MATLLCSCLLLLWRLASISAADTQPAINAFNYSVYKEQSSDDGTTVEHFYEAWGVRWQKHEEGLPDIRSRWHDRAVIANLPASFDPREKWPYCDSFNDIYDQGKCGSCWVFGSVTAITDRICIASNGTKHFYASPEDALTCSQGGSCQGGSPMAVYKYWMKHGIVSGGPYNSRYGCKPYRIPPCEDHNIGLPCDPSLYVDTPECSQYCDGEYSSTLDNEREYASDVYRLEDEDNIKADLYLNGPVTAVMEVYEDFLTYKCGVYKHRLGQLWYGHAVKLIGWGEEDGVKYWIGANSWDVEWGEDGFFRILRGENNCDIESLVIAGTPKD